MDTNSGGDRAITDIHFGYESNLFTARIADLSIRGGVAPPSAIPAREAEYSDGAAVRAASIMAVSEPDLSPETTPTSSS